MGEIGSLYYDAHNFVLRRGQGCTTWFESTLPLRPCQQFPVGFAVSSEPNNGLYGDSVAHPNVTQAAKHLGY